MKVPRHSFLIAAMALAGGALLSCTKSEDPAPTIEIIYPADNAVITDSVVVLKYRTTNFTSGHVHVDTDSSGGTHIATPPAGVDSAVLNMGYPGRHYIIVHGAHDNHAEIPGMYDSVSFTHP